MACCKVKKKQNPLAEVMERRFNEWRGIAASRLFAYSPRLGGFVYRSFGMCVAVAAILPVALALAVALVSSPQKPAFGAWCLRAPSVDPKHLPGLRARPPLGRSPLTPVTRVRISLGSPKETRRLKSDLSNRKH